MTQPVKSRPTLLLARWKSNFHDYNSIAKLFLEIVAKITFHELIIIYTVFAAWWLSKIIYKTIGLSFFSYSFPIASVSALLPIV